MNITEIKKIGALICALALIVPADMQAAQPKSASWIAPTLIAGAVVTGVAIPWQIYQRQIRKPLKDAQDKIDKVPKPRYQKTEIDPFYADMGKKLEALGFMRQETDPNPNGWVKKADIFKGIQEARANMPKEEMENRQLQEQLQQHARRFNWNIDEMENHFKGTYEHPAGVKSCDDLSPSYVDPIRRRGCLVLKNLATGGCTALNEIVAIKQKEAEEADAQLNKPLDDKYADDTRPLRDEKAKIEKKKIQFSKNLAITYGVIGGIALVAGTYAWMSKKPGNK